MEPPNTNADALGDCEHVASSPDREALRTARDPGKNPFRIMTWNVNGIKTLLQYNPWNTLRSYENILNALDADIVCFQETKITKKQVDRGMAVLPSYDSFFSSYSRKPEKGYSGTCIFTKRAVCVPIRAEEGISGLLPPPVGAPDDPIGGVLSSESIALNMQDVRTIDLEGRTTMVDMGLFVLINVYCPNETNEERLDFKLAFNAMLETRILSLIRLGREVIVLGDLNICAKPIDHCDPVKRAGDHPDYGAFENHPARKWFNEFTGPTGGSMVDLGRHFYPERKSMFTHWETRINARETNYGTRLDYILATPGLLPWIKTCEIQPHILGSDHCPVIAEFHETITTKEGQTLHLWDQINPPGRSKDPAATPPDPPRLAAKFYPEFSSEQRLLSNFFGKKGAVIQPEAPAKQAKASGSSGSVGKGKKSSAQPSIEGPSDAASAPALPTSAPLPASLSTSAVNAVSTGSASAPLEPPKGTEPEPSATALASPSIDLTLQDSEDENAAPLSAPLNGSGRSKPAMSRSPSVSTSVGGSNGSTAAGAAVITKKKGKKGQQTIASFFKAPAPPPPAPTPATSSKSNSSTSSRKGKAKAVQDTDDAGSRVVSEIIDDDENEQDAKEAGDDEELELLKEKALNGGKAVPQKRKKGAGNDGNDSDEIREAVANNEQASSAWSALFSAKVPPLCTMHNEPCKQWTVNKSGPNKNRVFWLCARPVGEGYDNGQKAKADVNPEFRCNYFKWESDIKRSASSSSSSLAGAGPPGKKKKPMPHGQG